jgi:2'-5' RNA ligase
VATDAAHLTLAFHGAVARDLVPAVGEAVVAVSAGRRRFDLVLTGAGTFGSPRRPRVLWAAVGGQLEALTSAHTDLVAALHALGLPGEDRAFHPHVTLARARNPRGDPGLAAAARALADRPFGRQAVSELVLFESRLGPGGARHLAVARGPFAA